jgi:hypothetical protein
MVLRIEYRRSRFADFDHTALIRLVTTVRPEIENTSSTASGRRRQSRALAVECRCPVRRLADTSPSGLVAFQGASLQSRE